MVLPLVKQTAKTALRSTFRLATFNMQVIKHSQFAIQTLSKGGRRWIAFDILDQLLLHQITRVIFAFQYENLYHIAAWQCV